jgi:hypothetical protein
MEFKVQGSKFKVSSFGVDCRVIRDCSIGQIQVVAEPSYEYLPPIIQPKIDWNALDSRLRGNDDETRLHVIPAKAGIQTAYTQ